jgi:hypothetical protein
VKKLSKRQREIQEEHRWYERNFPDPEMKKKRSPMWLMEIDIRDTKILAQRREIRRLRRRLEEAKAEIVDLKQAIETMLKESEQDLLDAITRIEPKDAPFPLGDVLPKVKSNHVYHEWVTDVLKPIAEQHAGWWWRKPWAWFLKMFRKEGSGW